MKSRNKPHLEYAHSYWNKLIQPMDIVVDATCGNGYDTLELAKLASKVIAIDIQQDAIKSAQKRLQEHPELYPKIEWHCQSHATFPETVQPGTIKLIVYNLGYLPGGDKTKTTLTTTTLQSILAAQSMLTQDGVICITCYPGHEEGKIEEKAILDLASTFDSNLWNCHYHRWINRKDSPTILLIASNDLKIIPQNS